MRCGKVRAKELRKKLFQVLEEVSEGNSLKIVPEERSSRLGRLVERGLGIEIEARDSGWSAKSVAAWEAEMNGCFGGDKRGAADQLD